MPAVRTAMRKTWPIAVFSLLFPILICGGPARAEVFGLGGGLMAYPLDLQGLKVELAASGVPLEGLARIPDPIILPHLLLRGRLSLPAIGWLQLEIARLSFDLPIERETETILNLDSTAIAFGLLGEMRALFFGFTFGLGTDLIQGRLGLSSTDPRIAELIGEFDLGERSWSVAAAHASGELELILGPLRLYFQGKYLYPLSRSGLRVRVGGGPYPWTWKAGLGLMLVL